MLAWISCTLLPVCVSATHAFKDSICVRTSLPCRSHNGRCMRPCRSLGQNFCTDDTILSDIVTAARVTASDVVVEVGPGTGNLTRHLLATRARVLAVEKDDTLIERLRDEFKEVRSDV
eukprot:GHRQ01016297.1.p2 GENE.GHRQ01016297.1~~GHRQ01016297.1.p2  ORF type:complete len:118 (+),score=13.97 GHRQ01016297.1:552-905(+)